MDDDTTQKIPKAPSFEQQVLARLDAIDGRLKALEQQAERRALETKPIWERALAEILELKQSLGNVERKIDVLSRDIIQVRADQAHLEGRVEKLEPKSTQ
jgi:chromosome segregation ATPase